ALLVAEPDPGLGGQRLHRLDEADVLHLLQERENVPAHPAAEAVPSENVVLQDEGVSFVHDRAEDLFDPVRLLDRYDAPAPPSEVLLRFREARPLLREEEELLGQIFRNEVDTVEG